MLSKFLLRLLLMVLITSVVVGCVSTTNHPAPVVDLESQYAKHKGYYTVSQGETLYLIAWRFDMDYQQLARINHIQPPYQLAVGQKIYLHASPAARSLTPQVLQKPVTPIKPVVPKKLTSPKTVAQLPTSASVPVPQFAVVKRWIRPTSGKIVGKYSQFNKGINIAGNLGQPIKAAASGQVVYAGHGLHAYGNLIIIKHNDTYLSAYANNKDLLVTEGGWVRQGQVIAHMGDSGTNKIMLHFEIRKEGKPVNPLQYLH